MRSSAFRLAVVSVFAVLAIACSGGSPPDGTGVGGTSAGGDAGAAGAGGSAAGTGGTSSGGTSSGGGSSGSFGIGGDGSGCEPTTCEAQGKSCGKIADGCGAVIDCGGCGSDEVCGLVAANVCAGIEDVCVRVAEEVACEGKQCGLEGDGCGGTYDCGSCPEGQACGLAEAYQCAQVPGGTDTECAARIESCASVGAECGVIGNGCGGTIDCDFETGGCPEGQLCGADPLLPQQCAPFAACVPLTAEEACTACGLASNGCGGVLDCEETSFGCTAPESCGGGGVVDVCGQGGLQCVPIAFELACAGRECGYAANGCGEAYDCSEGSACLGGEECVQGLCEPVLGCTPLTQGEACAGKACGAVGDGCGGTLSCGTCGGGQTCGQYTPFQCGEPPCVARTRDQACAGKECGVAYDGCGTAPANTFNCGSAGGACPSGEYCGAQVAYQCDPLPPPPACTPDFETCAEGDWACGIAVNSCGEAIDCADEGRVCNSTQTCVGGINGPTTCATVLGGDEEECPLCEAVPPCPTGVTRLAGRVITPGQSDGQTQNQVRVPNAFVYILRSNDPAQLPAIGAGLPAGSGLSCDRCDDQDLGPLLVGAVSDANGDFVLEGNVPVDEEFVLVTKIGKFRRAQRWTLPPSAACTTTTLPLVMSTAGESAGEGADDNPTRLPRTMSDGLGVNIPRMAVTTGAIDAMECVFYKMGLASSEFGNFGGANRVDLYRGATSGSPQGARINDSTPHDTALYNSLTRLEQYDMVVSDCEGGAWDSSFAQRGSGADGTQGGNVRQYVNRGGRMFMSHLSFSWLHQNGSTAYDEGTALATGLGQPATWNTGLNTADTGTGQVSILGGRTHASPRIQSFADWMVNEGVTSVGANYTFTITEPRSQNASIAEGTEEFVYRTGLLDDNGRVQQFSFNTPFGAPDGAACGRVAYSGFHVAATGGGTTPFQNVIFPSHCAGSLTGQEKILLYMLFDLGTCVGEPPEPPECTPLECGDSCGTVPDGCGGTLDCGDCVTCVPTTCEAEQVACATIANGCGGVLECPCNVCVPVSEEAACAGKCGTQSDGCSDVYECDPCPPGCVPLPACPVGINCGTISDGCNGELHCGSCPEGQACGPFEPNVCAPPTCRPKACDELEAGCGMVGDGCGGAINCGSCPPGQICTIVDGVPNQCAGCIPRTQGEACAGLECGLVGDGCGGTHSCGTCPSGELCGAVSPNLCDPGPACVPRGCPSGAECGVVGNGCGGSVSCGTCPPGELCGVFEPYQCGGCAPRTCQSAGAECGVIGDGCGDEVDCGECPPGLICGLGQANKCASLR